MKTFILFSAFKRHVSVLFLGFFLFSLNSLLYSSVSNGSNVIASNYYGGSEEIVYRRSMETHKDFMGPIRDKNIPPLNPYRIAGEAVSGAIVGTAGACGMIILYVNGANKNIWGGDISTYMISADMGWILGNQLGVYIVGNLGNETGSLPRTVLYGTAISLGIQALAFGAGYYYTSNVTNGPSDTPIFEIIEITAPIMGAVIGFNLTRKYKTGKAGGGLINLKDGKLSFSTPGVFLHPIDGENLVGVKVMNVNF